jgi:hypothetical protein
MAGEARSDKERKRQEEMEKQRQAREFMREAMRLDPGSPSAAESIQAALQKYDMLDTHEAFKIFQSIQAGRQGFSDYQHSLKQQEQDKLKWKREGTKYGQEQEEYQYKKARRPVVEPLEDDYLRARTENLRRREEPRAPELTRAQEALFEDLRDERKQLVSILNNGIEDPKTLQMVMPTETQRIALRSEIENIDKQLQGFVPGYQPRSPDAAVSRADIEGALDTAGEGEGAAMPTITSKPQVEGVEPIGEESGVRVGTKNGTYYVEKNGVWELPKSMKERLAVRRAALKAKRGRSVPEQEGPRIPSSERLKRRFERLRK